MTEPMTPERIDLKIQGLRKAAEELQQEVQACPALAKNLERIVVSIKMLELNCSDLLGLDSQKKEDGSA